MKIIRDKKSDKKVLNIVGENLLNYEDFLIETKDLVLYSKALKKSRCKFVMAHDSSRMINSFEFAMYATLMTEIFNFYNNDICIEVAKIYAMIEGKGDYKFRVIANMVDTVAVKVCSCWEYIFQILNKYFMLELNSMHLNKDILDKIYEKKMIFIKDEEGYRIEYVDWTDEERERINQELKKKKRVLNIGSKAKGFKKEIRKQGYVVSERVNQISALNSSVCVEKLKSEIRNTITHKKSSTFAFAIGGLDRILPTEGIECDRTGWVKIDEFMELIFDNLDVLKNAIQITFDIICLGDKLVHIENQGKKYKVVALECSKCHFKMNMIDELYVMHGEYDLSVECPKCDSDMLFKGEGEASESDYYQVFWNEMRLRFGTEE